MQRFVVIRDGFGDTHAGPTAAIQDWNNKRACVARDAIDLAVTLGLDSPECSPLRIGTVESTDAGAARLAGFDVDWVGSISFEATS